MPSRRLFDGAQIEISSIPIIKAAVASGPSIIPQARTRAAFPPRMLSVRARVTNTPPFRLAVVVAIIAPQVSQRHVLRIPLRRGTWCVVPPPTIPVVTATIAPQVQSRHVLRVPTRRGKNTTTPLAFVVITPIYIPRGPPRRVPIIGLRRTARFVNVPIIYRTIRAQATGRRRIQVPPRRLRVLVTPPVLVLPPQRTRRRTLVVPVRRATFVSTPPGTQVVVVPAAYIAPQTPPRWPIRLPIRRAHVTDTPPFTAPVVTATIAPQVQGRHVLRIPLRRATIVSTPPLAVVVAIAAYIPPQRRAFHPSILVTSRRRSSGPIQPIKPMVQPIRRRQIQLPARRAVATKTPNVQSVVPQIRIRRITRVPARRANFVVTPPTTVQVVVQSVVPQYTTRRPLRIPQRRGVYIATAPAVAPVVATTIVPQVQNHHVLRVPLRRGTFTPTPPTIPVVIATIAPQVSQRHVLRIPLRRGFTTPTPLPPIPGPIFPINPTPEADHSNQPARGVRALLGRRVHTTVIAEAPHITMRLIITDDAVTPILGWDQDGEDEAMMLLA